jgi:ElaB/YqjD/DUF883 family membrane-anchored ribosome-binding protein
MVYVLGGMLIVMGSWSIQMNVELSKMHKVLSNLNKLQKQNKQLRHRNQKLLAQREESAKRYAKHKAKKSQEFLDRAKSKITAAPAKVVPILGVASIVAMTTADVHATCSDIGDMNALEKELFEHVSESNISSEIEYICTLDLKKHLSPKLQNHYDTLINDISNRYDASLLWLKDAFNTPFHFFSKENNATQ